MSEADVVEIYRCTPRQVREYTIDVLAAGLVPFIQSDPGMGKSAIVKSIADEARVKMIDHRLSTSSSVDMSGLPEFYTDEDGHRRARFVPFDIFPLKNTKKPDGYNGWLLFLDEANSATKQVQAASYKIVLDKAVGQYDLHPDLGIVLAGNLMTSGAIVNVLSTAMQSRLIHLEMVLSHEEWLRDVALKENYDFRIIAYLNFKKAALMDFRPDHNEKTFCCPRTWEFVNKMVKGKADLSTKIPLLAGTITSGEAASFVTFSAIQEHMPDVKTILANPKTEAIPGDSQALWMVITHLAESTTKENFSKLCEYINRLPLQFRILYFKSCMIRLPVLRQQPEYAKAMAELDRYLNAPTHGAGAYASIPPSLTP